MVIMLNIKFEELTKIPNLAIRIRFRRNPSCGKRDQRIFIFKEYQDALMFFLECELKGLKPNFQYYLLSD